MGVLFSNMLVILWLTVLCFIVGARKQVSYDENLDYLQPYEPKKDYYQNSKDSTDGYEPQTYEPEDYYYPNPDESHPIVDYPRESTANSGHWTSSTAKQDSLYTTRNPDGYWSSSTTKLPEEDPSRPEYIPVDESEVQPDEYEDHKHSERPSHDYEQKYPMQVGSMRGIPGITFPDYKDIPLTHFSCSDKRYIPGFYADMETGCQVFHVCWPHRRESFLCPIGTIFNQAILACDYWYSSNCSLATHYYDVNSVSLFGESDYKETSMGSMIDTLVEAGKSESMAESSEFKSGSVSKVDLSEVLKFLPVKAKVVVYPETAGSSPKIIAAASVGKDEKPRVRQVRPKTEIYEEIDPGNIPEVVSESYSKIMAEASVGKGIKPRVEQMKPKTQIYEEVAPEKIPDQPKSTAAPYKPHQKDDNVYKVSTEKPKNLRGEVDPSLERIIDEIFDLVKNIVREARGLIPVSDFSKSKRQHESVQHETKRHLPMTRLKQRFITKPVEMPKQQSHLHSRPQTKVRNLRAGKRMASDLIGQYTDVSPSTKKALTESYLKRMKLGSG